MDAGMWRVVAYIVGALVLFTVALLVEAFVLSEEVDRNDHDV